jgi:hypothetical protein
MKFEEYKSQYYDVQAKQVKCKVPNFTEVVYIYIYIYFNYCTLEQIKTARSSHLQCKVFLFSTTSRTTLGLNQPPVQFVPEALSLGTMWQGREAGHSSPSSAEV